MKDWTSLHEQTPTDFPRHTLLASEVLPGAGGGLGHLAVQYAKAMVGSITAWMV
jgi:hypothetical protein